MRQQGFNLIELMIVIAIIGILTTIAYPSFQQHIIKVHRRDGQIALIQLAAKMTQLQLEQGDFLGATTTNSTSPQGFYQLSISDLSKNTYILHATPINSQKDDVCGILSLNHQNKKEPMLEECWR